MAFCPNCVYELPANALECSRCRAQFGEASAWKPIDEKPATAGASLRGAKIVSWFALVTGVLTVAAAAVMPLVSGQSLPVVAVAVLVGLGLATAAAGYFGLKNHPWAFWVLFGVSLVQVAEYFSETFSVSFIGPFSIKMGFVWLSPPSRLNINVLALTVAVLALITARRLTAASTRTRDEAPRAGNAGR
jgi:hypothetical protein